MVAFLVLAAWFIVLIVVDCYFTFHACLPFLASLLVLMGGFLLGILVLDQVARSSRRRVKPKRPKKLWYPTSQKSTHRV
ncbi:MAG: hypothetical protein AB7K24_15110 [Gemmataceae bacterium]